VSALVETVHPDHQHWAADDSDALLLKFEGGRIGIHSTTLTTPPRRDMAVVEGTLGRIMIDSLEFGGDQIALETPDEGITIVSVTPLEDGLFDLPMINDFARATLSEGAGGSPPICSAQSGLAVQATIDAAFRSAASKQLEEINY
jgi:predicted dehydrogenase